MSDLPPKADPNCHSEAEAQLRAEIEELKRARDNALIDLGQLRMCVVCGRAADASQPWPECETPECCTPDATPQEAWQHWREAWHRDREKWRREVAELRRDNERLRAGWRKRRVSGCCCTFDDDGETLLSQCQAHISVTVAARGAALEEAATIAVEQEELGK